MAESYQPSGGIPAAPTNDPRDRPTKPGIRVVEIRSERQMPGYVIRDEVWQHGNEQTPMHAAYNPQGVYIGTPKDAAFLCDKKGIAPEPRTPGAIGCSIGFCAREQKWYGWSHRAMYGFGVGHRVKPGHMPTEGGIPPGFVAQTLDDARRLAVAFAGEVS